MPDCSRHVDVSRLTQDECSHIINVIGKDILIRKTEAERVSELNKNLEDFRRSILLANISRKKRFPYDDFCLCGKHMFTFCFFVNGEECASCENYCCTKCRQTIIYNGEYGLEEFYICYLCCKRREIMRKTLSWFYENTDKRFKRFGSSKVLRAIYKENSTIEPRVITLLALCRELQPAKRVSFREIRRNVSSSNFSLDSSYPSSVSEQVDFRLRERQLKMQPTSTCQSKELLNYNNYKTDSKKSSIVNSLGDGEPFSAKKNIKNVLKITDDPEPVLHFTLYSPVRSSETSNM